MNYTEGVNNMCRQNKISLNSWMDRNRQRISCCKSEEELVKVCDSMISTLITARNNIKQRMENRDNG